jgi:integrase
MGAEYVRPHPRGDTTAFIEKRSGKRGASWRVRIRDPYTGELHSETFQTKKRAQDWLHNRESAKRSGNWRDPDAGKVGLGTLVDSFIASAIDLAPATVALYRTMARLYVAPSIGRQAVGTIRPQDLRDWTAALTKQAVGSQTIAVARRLVTRVLGQAVADGIIPANPATFAPPPRTNRKDLHVLSPGEVQAIAENIDPRNRAMVLVMAYCGLRFGEAAALRRGDVDMLRGRLTVARALAEVRGHITEGPTKTGKVRTVTMPKMVVKALGEHMASQPDPEGSDLIFTAADGGYIRRTNWRRRVWTPALEAAGISGVRPHDLRHFGAAVAIAAGAHPKAIQERLGHASITTTLNIYGALFPSLDEELAAKLDEVLEKGSRPTAEVVSLSGLSRTRDRMRPDE